MKRALALVAVTAVLPIASVLTASPAAAGNCSYPATSSAYALRISPTSTTRIPKGGSITISTRVVKGTTLCAGKNVYLYVHGRGEFSNGVPTFHLSRTGTTDSNGLESWTFTNQQSDFRFYTRLEGTSTKSANGLIQVS
ncbi:MAG: hypothetical protein JWP14_2158 [Frankiales bacterium]|nr:hypothetical protein [Frankiales bacterium]